MTASDLRIAQGQVRCGRCLAVFNALVTLYDDASGRKAAADHEAAASAPNDLAELPAPAAGPTLSTATQASMEDATHLDLELPSINALPAAGPPAPEPEAAALAERDSAAAPPTAAAPMQFGQSTTILVAAPDETAHPSAALAEHAANDEQIEDPSAANEPFIDVPVIVTEQASVVAANVGVADDSSDRLVRRTRYGWGAAALSALLGLQWVHVHRAKLATLGYIGQPLQECYRMLNQPIVPRWDVSRYEVRQQGAVGSTDSGSPLTVRASILNRAPRPQPLPLLRVILQDRYGNRIALRDLEPPEYLSRAKPGALLAPGQRIDAEVAMSDPGGKAVGFEIDACLRLAPGRYSCANDQSPVSK